MIGHPQSAQRAHRRRELTRAGAALTVLLVLLWAAAGARASAPFTRGILLRGVVVTMDRDYRVLHDGNVLVRGHGSLPTQRAHSGRAPAADTAAQRRPLFDQPVAVQSVARAVVGQRIFNILATFAEFEVDLLRMRTREGMAIARANGKLKGKQPKLSARQRIHVLKLVRDGDHTIAELAKLFAVSRATIYREIARAKAPYTVR